jgi:signal transduction histidine kinase
LYNSIRLYAVNAAVEFVPHVTTILNLAETDVTEQHWSVHNQQTTGQEEKIHGDITEREPPLSRRAFLTATGGVLAGTATLGLGGLSEAPAAFSSPCGGMVSGRKLAQRMARLDALRLAKEASEEASHAKSALLANMRHELRTPLHHIIGFTHLVMRHAQAVLPTRQNENLARILPSAEHLSGLSSDILDLSTLAAGHVEVQPLSFALQPLVDTCLHTMAPLGKGKPLRLLKALDPDLPMLYTDQTKLKHMLTHLLRNAVQFTETGTVTVTAQHQAEMLTVTVADTGIGIPEEACERIFEPFRRVDSSTTRQFGGTGLGLAISRRLARLLGGEVTVQSTVGVGSTFTVTLPLQYATAQSAPAHEVQAASLERKE